MTLPTQNDGSGCWTVDASHNPSIASSWHNTFTGNFNLDCSSLMNNHKKTGFSLDLVTEGDGGGLGVNPPSNLSYTIVHLPNVIDPKFEQTFSININWQDSRASVQGIEINRVDAPDIIFKRSFPSTPTTTEGWFETNPDNGILNPIVTNLNWTQKYVYQLRTNYQFVGSNPTFSEWVYLEVFERNENLRRRNDKCDIETLESMQVRLSQNFSEIPKKTRFSKIVKGGSRNVVCQTWRPQGWNDGKFLREDYPITFAVEDQKRQKQIENAGNPLCGGEPCSGNITTNITKISPYTGNLIFGTAAVNFREGVNNLESIQVYPCGKSLRRTGGKLPIN